jgi:hypothetical protein
MIQTVGELRDDYICYTCDIRQETEEDNIDKDWTFVREDFSGGEWGLLLNFLGVERIEEVVEIDTNIQLNSVLRRTRE